jgi:hypothetical protein
LATSYFGFPRPVGTKRKQSLNKTRGSKDGDRRSAAQTQNLLGGKTKTGLTLTGFLTEGLGKHLPTNIASF